MQKADLSTEIQKTGINKGLLQDLQKVKKLEKLTKTLISLGFVTTAKIYLNSEHEIMILKFILF
ncbi:hypothetical protein [Flavobacterium crocinum]|uniref:hypothetical protein n=1 Tax=Flavobacterium crocinum TaxID=2183896 RepID=UPI0011B25A38|nr:hypothetical protein [Flavobacterium crocinum]